MTTTGPMTIVDLRKGGSGHALLATNGPLQRERLANVLQDVLRDRTTVCKNDPSLSYLVVPWSEKDTDTLRRAGERYGLTRAWLFDQTSSFIYSVSGKPEQTTFGDEDLGSTGRPETWLTMLLHILHFAKNYDEALQVAEAIPVYTYLHQRRVGMSLAGACFTAVRDGNIRLATELVERGQQLGPVCPTVYHAAARAFVAAGDRDRAFEQVQKAAEWHYHDIESTTSSAFQDTSIEKDPALAPLCEEPRFKAFLERWSADMAAFAKAWRFLNSKPVKAIPTFEAMVKSGDSPISRGALCNLTSAYQLAGNAEIAWEVAAAGLERFKDSRLLKLLVNVGLKMGRHADVAAQIAKHAPQISDSDHLFVTVTYGALESEAFEVGCTFVRQWINRYGSMADSSLENTIQLFSLTRRAEEAARWADVYEARHGGSANAHTFAALASFARGDMDAAIEAGSKARQLDDTIFETRLDTPTKKMLAEDPRFGPFLRAEVARPARDAADESSRGPVPRITPELERFAAVTDKLNPQLDALELFFRNTDDWAEADELMYDATSKDPEQIAQREATLATHSHIAWIATLDSTYVGLWRGSRDELDAERRPVVTLDTEGTYSMEAKTVADYLAVQLAYHTEDEYGDLDEAFAEARAALMAVGLEVASTIKKATTVDKKLSAEFESLWERELARAKAAKPKAAKPKAAKPKAAKSKAAKPKAAKPKAAKPKKKKKG